MTAVVVAALVGLVVGFGLGAIFGREMKQRSNKQGGVPPRPR
jgi:uncharacterized membrane-anchored protein YhcB (DUF1043 family)